jgi:signal transduction histidine kinase
VLIGRSLLRVAVELHDPVGQQLALVRLDRPLRHRAPPDEGRERQAEDRE